MKNRVLRLGTAVLVSLLSLAAALHGACACRSWSAGNMKSETFLGKQVHLKIDRPLGSVHPEHRDLYFCLNYGYVPGVQSGDGEELDAYLLGVFEPVPEYTGTCIAIVRRRNEDDDKLVVVPDGVSYTDEQILALIEFIERYHDSYLVRT